jgi:hypothetical protein
MSYECGVDEIVDVRMHACVFVHLNGHIALCAYRTLHIHTDSIAVYLQFKYVFACHSASVYMYLLYHVCC